MEVGLCHLVDLTLVPLEPQGFLLEVGRGEVEESAACTAADVKDLREVG